MKRNDHATISGMKLQAEGTTKAMAFEEAMVPAFLRNRDKARVGGGEPVR